MKNFFLLLSVALLLLFADNGWCYTIIDETTGETINVGSTDTFIAVATKAGSPDAEEAWVQTTLESLEWYIKDDDVSYYSAYDDDGNVASNVIAFFIDSTNADEYADEDVDYSDDYADYYLIKNATYMALFENVEDFDWGVFNVLEIIAGDNLYDKKGDLLVSKGEVVIMNLNDYEISHVTSYQDSNISDDPYDPDPPTAHAPEPGTMMLLGFGLIGLAGIGRRKTKR